MFRLCSALGLLLSIHLSFPVLNEAFAEESKVQWDLSDLYPTPDAWSADYKKTEAAARALLSYKDTLGRSAAAMLKALDDITAVNKQVQRLIVYASLKADEDRAAAHEQQRMRQANALLALVDENTAWVKPEILAIGAGKIAALKNADKNLAQRFGFYLDNMLRAAPHALGAEGEAAIALTEDIQQQPGYIYGQLSDSELPYPVIKLSDGTEVRLDSAAYEKYRQVENRADRKLVFDSFWNAWKQFEGTTDGILTSEATKNEFLAKVRKFPGVLPSQLFDDNLPEVIYKTLVAQANAGLPTLHRYFGLRKKLPGIQDELDYYDVYPSMFTSESAPRFSLPDAQAITLEALKPYGEEYLGLLRTGFSGKWLDPYPRARKASGAYMNGMAYDVHPYLLMNYNDDYDSLSTYAHEWGHAIHTLLANKNQRFENAVYSTFIAETASIANEMLLSDYMIAHAKSGDEKLFYLGEALETIRATFFRQVMLAEFQLAIHEELEKGNALSGVRISEIYCDLLKKYHGEEKGVMSIDPKYCIEWAFIPHFYWGFYVYQYATSMVGAAELTAAIGREGRSASDRFLAMLKAGGSDYPSEIYKRAGIDMATPGPYQALIARMDRILDEIMALKPGLAEAKSLVPQAPSAVLQPKALVAKRRALGEIGVSCHDRASRPIIRRGARALSSLPDCRPL